MPIIKSDRLKKYYHWLYFIKYMEFIKYEYKKNYKVIFENFYKWLQTVKLNRIKASLENCESFK